MIFRVIKILFLLAFLWRLTICHFWNATINETDVSIEKDEHEIKEYPNMLMEMRQQEGVRLEKNFTKTLLNHLQSFDCLVYNL